MNSDPLGIVTRLQRSNVAPISLSLGVVVIGFVVYLVLGKLCGDLAMRTIQYITQTVGDDRRKWISPFTAGISHSARAA